MHPQLGELLGDDKALSFATANEHALKIDQKSLKPIPMNMLYTPLGTPRNQGYGGLRVCSFRNLSEISQKSWCGRLEESSYRGDTCVFLLSGAVSDQSNTSMSSLT